MRIAALYDIHGNLPALRAVLADVRAARPNLLVLGGDVVAGPMPEEVLDELFAAGYLMRWVMGNTDRSTLDAANVVAVWAAEHLRAEQLMLLETFQPTVATGGVLFCHGSPRSDTEVLTPLSPDARVLAACSGVRQRVVVCGHTHRQFDRAVDGHRIVNAGSVGLPWEGEPGAYWLLLEDGEPQLQRTLYDVDAALDELRGSGAPWVDELLRDSLLEPVDADAKSRDIEASAG